jgi:Rap1a immunity proteins
MSLLCLVLFLLLILPVSSVEAASERTGYDFLLACEGKPGALETIGEMRCAAYLLGFLDSYAITSQWLPRDRRFICLPKQGLQGGQALLVLTKWLREHPSELHQTVRVVAFQALKDTFPCP